MISILSHIIVTGGVRVSYIIQYTPEDIRRYPQRKKIGKIKWGKVLLLLCMILAGIWMRVKGIPDFLIPGDPDVTKSAAKTMVESIQYGDTFNDAVTVFCKEILDGAQIESIR